ncbi:porin family protein [Marinilabilia salmonicolor]|uniref:outer membrane beta-barrel protein n=1 Tax=Marinilabilia salmonicolor TaxID=989 RepID=UPI00029AE219|nr:outer membrane beta-barrel protein [Marinilabilia salmonicolor]
MDFLKWYKNTVDSGQEEPPDYTWEDIQNDLDIDHVYERLERSLQKDRRKIWIWRASSAAGILLLLSVGTMLINRFRQTTTEPPIAINSSSPPTTLHQPESIAPPLLQTDTSSLQEMSHTLIIPIQSTQKKQKNDTDKSILMADLQPEPDNQTIIVNPDSFHIETASPVFPMAGNAGHIGINKDRLSPMSFIIPEAKMSIDYETLQAHIEMPEPKQEPIFPERSNTNQILSRITIFAAGELANTWLISPKTKEAFDPQDFTANQTTIKQNYGIGISGNITERWEIVGQFSFARQTGQHYKEYYQGKYVSNNIDLEYTDIALRARYRPFKRNLNHAFSTGLYSAFLNDAHQFISNQRTDISTDYTKTDFGIIAGYQYFAPVTNKITLAAGAFYRQGLKNIFAGNDLISSNLNQSSNTSFNFTISVGYTFSL